MKKTVRRAIAVTTAGAAGLAGALAFQVPAATAAEARPGGGLTNYGMAAWGSGLKFNLDGIELRSLRSGFSAMECTRTVGDSARGGTLDAVPIPLEIPQEIRDIIDIEVVRTTNKSYEAGAVLGALATTNVGSVRIGGGTLPGLPIPVPRLVIEGLTSEADAFVDRATGEFGRANRISLGDLSIEIDRESIPEELKPLVVPLLDVIDQVQEGVAPVREIVTTIVELVAENGSIPLPGLGSITLAQQKGQVTETSARSQSRALVINIDPDGADGDQFGLTRIELGRALTSIGGGVHGGVFRSRASAFKGSVLGGVLDLISPSRSIPCEGTGGEVVTFDRFDTGTIVGGLLVNLQGVGIEMQGEQFKRGRIVDGRRTNQGWMRGYIQSSADVISVPSAGIELQDVLSKVIVNNRDTDGRKVASTPLASIGTLLVNGQEVAAPRPGEPVEFEMPGGSGTGILSAPLAAVTTAGASVRPLVLTLLPEGGDVLRIDLAKAVATIRQTR